MRKKKVRGLKKKTNSMVKRIEEETMAFPTDYYHSYWHMHLPVADAFIDSNKTPFAIKRLCIQTLINQVEHLTSIKPESDEKLRVVAAIDWPRLSDSQIIVFKDEEYYSRFFNRNDEDQKWTLLSNERDLQREMGISISTKLHIIGYNELISDEDYHQEGEIWFIGEVR
ncbi:DUF3916 domain-containing protein [Viridibacillus sp. YIM B01967]|uniref:DUF3916 domain-containing protein n=1 Tax=Viridibacillus soli TaxID=2798301 RepID=A0ABS1H3I9_9BACL|nr:DUF3916 domain-containing protein [Viridibacillus soli]MBK3493966.1 DUF3916 domain-containing protein [Viridibacillus soli]